MVKTDTMPSYPQSAFVRDNSTGYEQSAATKMVVGQWSCTKMIQLSADCKSPIRNS